MINLNSGYQLIDESCVKPHQTGLLEAPVERELFTHTLPHTRTVFGFLAYSMDRPTPKGFPSLFWSVCSFESLSRWLMGWVHRVVGNIWRVGAGESSSRPVRDANSGNPHRVD